MPRRNRPIMNALRSQIRMLEGNPGLPGGVLQRNPIPATQKIREAVWQSGPAHELSHVMQHHTSNPDPQTGVCPPGTAICGDPVPGHPPPCCPIEIKGPTPAGTYNRQVRHRLTLRQRLARFLGIHR